MEPIEINAGTHYLRQFRADDRLDDRPALLKAFGDTAIQRAFPERTVTTEADAAAYIAACDAGWRDDTHLTWAIAELTTGALLGEVSLDLDSDTAHLTVWTHPDARRSGAASTAVDTVVRFGFGALELEQIDLTCDVDNAAVAAVARRCGFTRTEPAPPLDGTPAERWSTRR